MTNIRSGGGAIRAQQVVPTQAPQVQQAPKAPVAAPLVAFQRKVVTDDDRSGASSRAFDDPAAQNLKARVGGGAGAGFGINAGDRPMRTAPGAPAGGAWTNPGHGMLAHITAFPAHGPLDVGRAYQGMAAACILGASIMGGAEACSRVLGTAADAPVDTLTDADRVFLRDVAAQVRRGGATWAQLQETQVLLARAGCRTVLLDAVVADALKAPTVNALSREQRDQLKVLDRLVRNGTGLDAAQAGTLGALLTAAHKQPIPVIRAWDPFIAAPATVRTLRAAPAAPGTPAAQLYEPEPVALARGLSMLASDLETLEVPPPGEPSHVLQDLLAQLLPSQAYVVQGHLGADPEDPSDVEADHALLLGRRRDGMAYLYNPDPRRGRCTLAFGRVGRNQNPEFAALLQDLEPTLRDDVDGEPTWAFRVRA